MFGRSKKPRPTLEIGEVFHGKQDLEAGDYSHKQAAIYRHAEKTWFVCSSVTMRGWVHLDVTFYDIVDDQHRMIMYPGEWIAQYNDIEDAWIWFDIMNGKIKLSNAEYHIKFMAERKKKVREAIRSDAKQDKPKPQMPGHKPDQGNLFGE